MVDGMTDLDWSFQLAEQFDWHLWQYDGAAS